MYSYFAWTRFVMTQPTTHNPLVCYRAGLGSMVAEDLKIPNRFVGLSKWVVDAISTLNFEFQGFHQKNLIELHAIICFVSTFTWLSLVLWQKLPPYKQIPPAWCNLICIADLYFPSYASYTELWLMQIKAHGWIKHSSYFLWSEQPGRHWKTERDVPCTVSTIF